MATYQTTITVEAEQFLPDEGKIPAGVVSDGPRNPRTDPRSAWVLHTANDGTVYLNDKDYIVTTTDGGRYRLGQEQFEALYTPMES